MPVNNLLGLDIGEKRIGIARVNIIAKIPEPLTTLANDENFMTELDKLILEHDIDKIVIGLPRDMNGRETQQTDYIRQFVTKNLSKYTVSFQDETLTSVVADERLGNKRVSKSAIDSVAACIILEDYVGEL